MSLRIVVCVAELFGATSIFAAPTPEWVKTAVHQFMPPTAPGAVILSADGLWSAIQHWDESEIGQRKKFMYGNLTQNQYMVAAFLANTNQESLLPFTNASNFDANFGVSELVCDGHVGYCSGNSSISDPKQCEESFVQRPTDCHDYGVYWGRGAVQVTCRKGSGPNGTDFCKAYSDINVYYKDYLVEQGWNESTIELEPWHVSLDPTLAWGSAIIFWMDNNGHGNTGCYSCHQWAQLRDFAGTIEDINGGWPGGEAPLSNGGHGTQNRVDSFLKSCELLGLDPTHDGWNGLTIQDECPCERYFGNPAYCKGKFPAGSCTASTNRLPAGYPFDLSNSFIEALI